MSVSAKDIETRASEWVIERQTTENWGAEDQARLDAWLNETMAHSIAYWRLNQCWDSTYRLSVLRGTDRSSVQTKRPARNWRAFVGIAAVIVAVAGLGVRYLSPAASYTTYDTDTGGRKILSLADGSKIELNTQTKLRVAKGSGGRKVWLDHGEAYFEIKHDVAHPFVVMAGTHRILDLGTKFTVREEKNRIEVALLEGRAQVQSTENGERKSEILSPGDVAIASPRAIAVKRQTEQDLADRLAWQRGVLVFRHVTLADAAAEFNRYNRQQILITDPKVARLEIVALFQPTIWRCSGAPRIAFWVCG